MKRLTMPIIVLMVWMSVQLSCSLTAPKADVATADLVNTAAAETVRALGTQLATLGTPTPNALVTSLPTLSPSAIPTHTVNTQPVQATNSPQSTSCDVATFQEDVTIPDGTPMLPGTSFTKTWKIKNMGSCTWESGYQVVFGNDGHAMSGPASQALQGAPVAPGESVLVSLKLTAPQKAGEYKGVWKLRNTKGETFGKFWVSIRVENTPEGEFSFVYHLCSAEWRNGAGSLSCPGTQGDAMGYALRLDTPQFENGYIDNEPALVMAPQDINDGKISGRFMPVEVPANSHFQTVVGCLGNANGCDVKIILKAQAQGESEKTLGEWHETYDGNLTYIDIDLGSKGLTDKPVSFTFIVHANGSAVGDRVFWLLPRIKR